LADLIHLAVVAEDILDEADDECGLEPFTDDDTNGSIPA
jgi:hypothetical protein